MFARERHGPDGLLVVVEKVRCCIYVAVSPAGGMENVAVAKANSAGRTEMNVGRPRFGPRDNACLAPEPASFAVCWCVAACALGGGGGEC